MSLETTGQGETDRLKKQEGRTELHEDSEIDGECVVWERQDVLDVEFPGPEASNPWVIDEAGTRVEIAWREEPVDREWREWRQTVLE